MAVLRSATQGRPFTAAQVGQLIDAMTFSDEQVQTGAMLYPLVVDPQPRLPTGGRLRSADGPARRDPPAHPPAAMVLARAGHHSSHRHRPTPPAGWIIAVVG